MFTRLAFGLLLLPALAVSVAAAPVEPKRDRFGDPLPEGAIARLGSLRLRSEQSITRIAFSADGKTLTACESNTLSFWDAASGKMIRRVAIKTPAQARLRRLSGDGKTLIQSGYDNVLRSINTATGAEQCTFNHAQCGAIQALDVSRDGKILVAIHHTSIALWDVAAGKLLHEFKGPQIVPLSPHWLVALTPDGKQLVLPHADGSLHLVDTASGKEVRAFEMPPIKPGIPPFLRVQRLAVSPDGRYLAYGGAATPLTLCELATGKRLREVAPPQGILTGLAFTPNGRFLAVDIYATIHLFGVLSGKEIRKLRTPLGTGSQLVFSPNGRTLAALRGGYTINLWDVAAGRQAPAIVGHEAAVQSMVFFPDGKRLVSVDSHQGMIVWDIASGRDLVQRENNTPCLCLVVDADGERVRFAGYDLTAHRWDPRTGGEERQQVVVGLSTNSAALSPDARSMAVMAFGASSGDRTRQLRLYDLKDNKSIVLAGLPPQGWVSQIVFAPDSRRLATISNDGALRLWNRDTGKIVREFKTEAPGRQLWSPTFAADGRSLALFDGPVCIREIASGKDRLQIPTSSGVFALAYSPDARFLACGQSDGNIVIYSAASGKQLAQWQGQQGGVRALAFSADSRMLASAGANGTILIWKVPDNVGLPAIVKADQLVALWQTLADDDAARANRALANLTAAAAQAVPLIKERFRATEKSPTAERLARLIAELDDDAFNVREHATRELSEAGPDAADALRKALANDPSPEVKRRIDTLLERVQKGGDPERRRCLRAIEVLERIGTSAAKDLLQQLNDKPLSVELHEEIAASVRRIDERLLASSRRTPTP